MIQLNSGCSYSTKIRQTDRFNTHYQWTQYLRFYNDIHHPPSNAWQQLEEKRCLLAEIVTNRWKFSTLWYYGHRSYFVQFYNFATPRKKFRWFTFKSFSSSTSQGSISEMSLRADAKIYRNIPLWHSLIAYTTYLWRIFDGRAGIQKRAERQTHR